MRITYDQARFGFTAALNCVDDLRQDHEAVEPAWIETDNIEGTDLTLLSVRFPGNCKLSDKATESVREDNPDHDGYAVGIFVVLLDSDGEPVFARHTSAGPLPIDRHGKAAHR